MKTILILITAIMMNPANNFAQSIEGDYYIETTNGRITLSLKTTDHASYSGNLIDDTGVNYSILAQQDGQGGIIGTLSGGQGSLGFAAYPGDGMLNVYLAPVGMNGQPDFSQAQNYMLKRMENPQNGQEVISGPLNSEVDKATWTGTYYGSLNGTEAILTLNEEKDGVQGKIDAGGYLYHINGKINEDHLEGELIDPQTQGRMLCQGNRVDGSIKLRLNYSSAQQSVDLVFYADRNQLTGANIPAGNESAGANVERDPALVGNWLYSDSYTSGDYGFVSQWRLIVNADGTYLYGDAKVAGGGPGTSASSEGGGYTRGQWKTQNKTIYINEGYGWQPYAGYYIEGNSMLMKFSDGSKQVWKRY